MIRELVRLRNRNQMTLPAEIAKHLSLKPNALLELVINPESDHVELRHAEVIRAGTPRAKREEELALKDIREGRFSTFANPEELARNLDETRAKAEMQERIESLQQQVDGLVMSLRQMNVTQGAPAIKTPTAAEGVPAAAVRFETSK